MAHLHIYTYTECSLWVNCVKQKFALNVVIQHLRDEDVSEY